MSPHFFAYIIHIFELIETIDAFLSEDETGLKDSKTYMAILYAVQTLSESACKLPQDIKECYPNVPWKDFLKMRNAIAHDYLGNVFREDILKFIENEIPLLQSAMEQHLPNWKELRSRFEANNVNGDCPN